MTAPAVRTVALWDPVVRLTHWSVAVIVLVNALLTDGGSPLHVWMGWAGMALLALRLLWGLVGPAEARFSAFPPSLRGAMSHLADLVAGRARTYSSHNPAGALMAYALWATLAVLTATGLVMTGGRTPMEMETVRAAVRAGDWSVLVDEGEDGGSDGAWKEAAEEVHDMSGNLILILAFLHVAGVAVESRALRRNLLQAMLFGARR